jgi:5'-nucleotidase
MQSRFYWIFFLLVTLTLSCTITRISRKDNGKLELVFLQINDVYEIAPVSGGKVGGMARIATLKKQLLKQNPNTFLVMAGDFVSPSVYNTIKYQGRQVRGKQMIEVMNAAGTDLAIFGNHEFDITEAELQERINESSFQWIASNSFHKKNGITVPFEKESNNKISVFPPTFILPLRDADGTTIRIGLIGITLPFNKASYVDYTDPLETAKKLYAQLKDSCDAVVAITHQKIVDDLQLAQELPSLSLILGGHEHDMHIEKSGNVFVTKAHANAKSAYIIKLVIDRNKKSFEAIPTLKMIDETIAADSATDVVVKKWTTIADKSYDSIGFDADKIITDKGDSLDGRETMIRSTPTNLTQIITAAMADACPEASVAINNAGSIRLDDVLFPPIIQYDMLRALPFGGAIREAEIKGSLLLQVLEAGQKNVGTGGYLHYYPLQYLPSTSDPTRGEWTLKGSAIDSGKIYRVAFNDFLVSGREANLGFLNKDNPAMIKLYDVETSKENPKSDIRLAIVRYLEKLNRN